MLGLCNAALWSAAARNILHSLAGECQDGELKHSLNKVHLFLSVGGRVPRPTLRDLAPRGEEYIYIYIYIYMHSGHDVCDMLPARYSHKGLRGHLAHYLLSVACACLSVSLSLSLKIYIYIYIYICVFVCLRVCVFPCLHVLCTCAVCVHACVWNMSWCVCAHVVFTEYVMKRVALFVYPHECSFVCYVCMVVRLFVWMCVCGYANDCCASILDCWKLRMFVRWCVGVFRELLWLLEMVWVCLFVCIFVLGVCA